MPAMPTHTTSGNAVRSPSASWITSNSVFSVASSPALCRLAPPARPSPTTWPRASASQATVLLPPASIPSTCTSRSLYWPCVLAPLDYAVIVAYLAAITAFGSWFGRFQHTTRDYFLSGHSVPWWAVCCTVVATETSTLTFIGIPATAYAGNMTFLQLALGYVIGRADRQRAVHSRLLPRRSGDLVRAAAAALRATRDLALGRAVPGDPIAGRRHPPLRHVDRHQRRHRRAHRVGHAGRRHGDDSLHRARRRRGRDLDRRGADVRLRRWRVGGGRRPARPHSWRLGRGGAARIGGRQVHVPRSQHRPVGRLHAVDRPHRRRRAHAGHARHRSVPGAAPAGRHERPGGGDRTGAQRRRRVRAVHPVPAHRRHALHVPPARAACRARWRAPIRCCPTSS